MLLVVGLLPIFAGFWSWYRRQSRTPSVLTFSDANGDMALGLLGECVGWVGSHIGAGAFISVHSLLRFVLSVQS